MQTRRNDLLLHKTHLVMSDTSMRATLCELAILYRKYFSFGMTTTTTSNTTEHNRKHCKSMQPNFMRCGAPSHCCCWKVKVFRLIIQDTIQLWQQIHGEGTARFQGKAYAHSTKIPVQQYSQYWRWTNHTPLSLTSWPHVDSVDHRTDPGAQDFPQMNKYLVVFRCLKLQFWHVSSYHHAKRPCMECFTVKLIHSTRTHNFEMSYRLNDNEVFLRNLLGGPVNMKNWKKPEKRWLKHGSV